MSWVSVAVLALAIPLAAILATAAVIGFTVWVWHRSKMAKLHIEEQERQAEADREMLGLGSKDIQAHLQDRSTASTPSRSAWTAWKPCRPSVPPRPPRAFRRPPTRPRRVGRPPSSSSAEDRNPRADGGTGGDARV